MSQQTTPLPLKRIRTIGESLALIKQADPGTALTYNAIKKFCQDGKIKHFLNGNKVLVNYDDLLEQLAKNFS